MIRLAYSTFGLTKLPFLDAIDAVARAGYEGVEISFHRDVMQINKAPDVSSIR